MKFAICNEIFQGWTFEAAAAFAAKAGYDAMEIAPFTFAKYVTDISAEKRKDIREIGRRNEIAICGIHWVLAQTEGLHLTHSDAAVRNRTAEYLVELVDFCADIGGKVMVVGSPKQRNLLPGVSAEQAWAWAVETFGKAVKWAGERDVVICLEPLSPAETDFISTAAEAIRFIDQFRSRNFQIILDVKAMCSEAKPIPQIISESAGRFAHFHANDKNLKGPGFGEVDFAPIAAALDKTGYADQVSVEVFNFDDGAEVIATKSMEYLRRVFGGKAQNGG